MADNSAGLRKRPMTVWILCILNGVLAAFLIAASLIAEGRGYPGWGAAISGVAGLLITIAAHATWFGYRWGRLALLALLTVFLGIIIAQSALLIDWANQNAYSGRLVDAAFVRAGLSLVWLALNAIILFGKKARMFFA